MSPNPSALEEALRRISREHGLLLGQIGVRPEDERWIRQQAETIASLAGEKPRLRLGAFLYRLARKAARTAR